MAHFTILMIDDDPDLVAMVTELLSLDGHRVIAAPTAPAGVELAIREQPDLILADLFMPGMDGATAVRMLKAAERTHHVPIVALTGATGTDIDYLVAAGCVEYVPKLLIPHDLRRVVRTLLR